LILNALEQQYVRTVHKRRGSLILCKLRELWLARQLSGRVAKEEVSAAYLWRAYFGARMNGYSAARRQFVASNTHLDFRGAANIVACLKYPRTITQQGVWEKRHARRVYHILAKLRQNGTRP